MLLDKNHTDIVAKEDSTGIVHNVSSFWPKATAWQPKIFESSAAPLRQTQNSRAFYSQYISPTFHILQKQEHEVLKPYFCYYGFVVSYQWLISF